MVDVGKISEVLHVILMEPMVDAVHHMVTVARLLISESHNLG